jgi:ABC-type transport system substrate-binding protein
MAVSPVLSNAVTVPDNLNTGPYVEKIVYQVIASQDQRIAAILAGTVETDNSFFNPSNLPLIQADPDVSIAENLRNGYGHIRINCRDYPLNISGFRRAFAYAYDKRAVQQNIMLGYSQLHDSLVPYTNSFSIEDDLEWHYYDADPITGNQILDDLGFTIQGDGWRTAPDGSPIDIEIIYGANTPDVGGGCAQLGVDALASLHIHAHTLPQDFNTYISTLDSHGAYDMIFYATNFYGTDVDWLAYSYWSERANEPLENPSNFANATYDSYRDDLLNGVTYAEVYEAAAEMQKILHYNVPLLITYENIYMQAYRNDVYEGHVDDLGRYIAGPWTARKVHKIDGTYGGTFTIAIGEEPDSFNIFTSNSAYSAAIQNNLYPRLYDWANDLSPYGNLAENLITEVHSDNPAQIPENHTRFTVDIVQNATWSDGTPLTAADVAFTFTYFLESHLFGNPAGLGLQNLVSVTAPTPYRVVFMFDTESYWHFSNFAYSQIIPQHIFNDVDGIGYAGWNTWNPVFDPAEPNVNCGPFTFTDFEAGEFYEITANTDFHYYPENWPPPEPTTTPTEPTTGPGGFNPTLAIVAGAVGAAVVILVGGFVLLRQK